MQRPRFFFSNGAEPEPEPDASPTSTFYTPRASPQPQPQPSPGFVRSPAPPRRSASAERECPVCMEPAGDSGLFLRTDCGHEFCADCMRDVATHVPKHRLEAPCPLCRADVMPLLEAYFQDEVRRTPPNAVYGRGHGEQAGGRNEVQAGPRAALRQAGAEAAQAAAELTQARDAAAAERRARDAAAIERWQREMAAAELIQAQRARDAARRDRMRRHEARLWTETEARLQTAREARREAAAGADRRAERRRAQTTANTATNAGQAVRTRDEHMSTVTVRRGSQYSSGGRDRSDLHEMIQEEEAFLRERAAEEERVREEEREAEQRQQRLEEERVREEERRRQRLEEERVREEDRRRQRLEELGRVREEAHARGQQRRLEREELERAQAERMVAEARAQAELESQAEAEDDEDSSASDMSVVDSDDDSEDGDDDDDGEAMTRRFSTVMGAEAWQVGQIVQYNSSSNGGWVYARIEQLHDDGRISLDVRRRADPARIRRPVGGGAAHAAPAARDGLYRAGDPVSVFSRTMVSRHNIVAVWVAFFSRCQRWMLLTGWVGGGGRA